MKENKSSLASMLKRSLLKKNNLDSFTFLHRGEIDNEETLTGKEVHQKISKIANYLTKKRQVSDSGTAPVMIAMSSGLNTVLTINACIYAGIVFLPIQVAKRENVYEKARNLFKDCGITEVIVDDLGGDFIEHLKENYDLPQSTNAILIDSDEIERASDSNDLLKGFVKPLSDHCFIQHTSGSTGNPKGIVLDGYSVLNNQEKVGEFWSLNEVTVLGCWMPHYHDMGLVSVIYPLLRGAHLVVMSPLAFVQKPIRWLKMISHYKISLTGAPPFAYRLCMEYFKKNPDTTIDLSSWNCAFCGAESVPKSLFVDFYQMFKNYGMANNVLFNCYGMAEVVSYISGSPRSITGQQENIDEEVFVAPIYLNKDTYETVKVVHTKTNTIVSDGVEGEIWIQNDSMALGYVTSLDRDGYALSQKGFDGKLLTKKGAWLKTGDRGIIKGEYLYILGRIKDVVISNGVNYSALEIEIFAAKKHPTLNPFGAAVFQEVNKENPQTTLLIECGESRPNLNLLVETKSSIKKMILQQFSVKLDYIYLFKRGALPRTSSGKIKRQLIASNFDLTRYGDKVLS